MAVDPALLAPRQMSAKADAATPGPAALPAPVPSPAAVRDDVQVSLAPAQPAPVPRAITEEAVIAPREEAVNTRLPAPVRATAKPGPPAVAVPAKNAATAARVAAPQKAAIAGASAVRAEPALDVTALKARLRDTDAIGVFTKLALRNQVDDLLGQFRAHYLDTKKGSVASLRQPYDLLVMKVLALLQDNDPPLARTISGSREAIWGILADPEKFKAVN